MDVILPVKIKDTYVNETSYNLHFFSSTYSWAIDILRWLTIDKDADALKILREASFSSFWLTTTDDFETVS